MVVLLVAALGVLEVPVVVSAGLQKIVMKAPRAALLVSEGPLKAPWAARLALEDLEVLAALLAPLAVLGVQPKDLLVLVPPAQLEDRAVPQALPAALPVSVDPEALEVRLQAPQALGYLVRPLVVLALKHRVVPQAMPVLAVLLKALLVLVDLLPWADRLVLEGLVRPLVLPVLKHRERLEALVVLEVTPVLVVLPPWADQQVSAVLVVLADRLVLEDPVLPPVPPVLKHRERLEVLVVSEVTLASVVLLPLEDQLASERPAQVLLVPRRPEWLEVLAVLELECLPPILGLQVLLHLVVQLGLLVLEALAVFLVQPILEVLEVLLNPEVLVALAMLVLEFLVLLLAPLVLLLPVVLQELLAQDHLEVLVVALEAQLAWAALVVSEDLETLTNLEALEAPGVLGLELTPPTPGLAVPRHLVLPPEVLKLRHPEALEDLAVLVVQLVLVALGVLKALLAVLAALKGLEAPGLTDQAVLKVPLVAQATLKDQLVLKGLEVLGPLEMLRGLAVPLDLLVLEHPPRFPALQAPLALLALKDQATPDYLEAPEGPVMSLALAVPLDPPASEDLATHLAAPERPPLMTNATTQEQPRPRMMESISPAFSHGPRAPLPPSVHLSQLPSRLAFPCLMLPLLRMLRPQLLVDLTGIRSLVSKADQFPPWLLVYAGGF
jgi:hypothetical protein